MKTMEEAKFKNMTDINLAIYLRDYGSVRGGEIRALTLAAADRILDMKAKIRQLEGSDDLK